MKATEKARHRLEKIVAGLHAAAQDDDSFDCVTFTFPDSKESGVGKIRQSRALEARQQLEWRFSEGG